MTNQARIILISDNHGLAKAITDIRDRYCHGEYLFHCGDSEMPPFMLDGFAAVQGNNDEYNAYQFRKVLNVAGHRILLVHGHRDMFFGHYDMLAERGKEAGCDIVMFGHTHIFHDSVIDGIRLLNPGSIWRNRDGSEPSYMIVDINGSEVKATRMSYHI